MVCIAVTSTPATAAPIQIKAPCRIEVDNAHISSTTFTKESKLAVKVVFRSICNMDQENLVMKVQIRKSGFILDHPITAVIIRKFPFVPANKIVRIQGIMVYCKNTRSTTYFGVAESTATQSGKLVRALPTQSKNKVTLRCGT